MEVARGSNGADRGHVCVSGGVGRWGGGVGPVGLAVVRVC